MAWAAVVSVCALPIAGSCVPTVVQVAPVGAAWFHCVASRGYLVFPACLVLIWGVFNSSDRGVNVVPDPAQD
eukprot:11210724-Lingulodinium_polyedra.AAC.1